MKTDPEAKGNRDSDKLIADKKSPPPVSKSTGKPAQHKRRKPSDVQFTNLIEKLNEGFVALDPQMNYVYINQLGSELLKRKAEDLIGKNYWEEYPQDKDTSFGKAYLRALETQTPIEIEDYYAPGGRWFVNRIYPSESGLSIFFNDVTENKNTEQILRQKDEQLRRITDVTPILFSECSRDLRYLFVNRTAAEFLGFPAEEIIGKPIRQILGDEAFEKILPYIERTLQGERVEYELEIPYRTAGKRFMQVTYIPKRDEAGIVNGWLATIIDITERKRAEQERNQLLESERAQRARAEQAGAEVEQELAERKKAERALGMWAGNPLSQESRSAWKRYGLALLATAIAIFLRALLHPVLGDLNPLTTLFGAVAFSVWYGGIGPALLTVIIGFLGVEWFIIEPHYAIILDLENLAGLGIFLLSSLIVMSLGQEMRRAQRHAQQSAQVAVARQEQAQFQLAEQKRVEAALRESERKFSLIYDKLPFAAALSRPTDGVLVDVNKAFERIFGWSKLEAIGKSSLELGINPDAAGRTRVLSELQSQESLHDAEITMNTRSNGERRFLLNLDLVSIDDEKYILQTAQDITERKQAETALAEHSRQQEALYQLADQLHQAKSVGHVFNAAMDAIFSALQCDRASILLFDDTDKMRFVAWRGLSDEYREATDGHSPWNPDEKNPAPICMNDITTADLSESLRTVVQSEGIGSLAFIPLVSKGKLIGKFMTYFNAPHRFDEAETDLCLTIARQLAIGIQRKRDEDEITRAREHAEKTADRITRLQQITAALTGPATPSELAETILRQGTQASEAAAGILVELLDNGQELKTIAALGYPASAVRAEPVPVSAPTPMSDCIRTRQAVWIESQADFARQYPSIAEFRGTLGNESTVALPLLLGDKVLGGLAFSFIEARAYDEEERNFFLAVAERCAQALQRARGDEALRTSEERFRILANAVPSIIWTAAPDGTITYANDQWFHFVGISPEENATKWPELVLHPDDRDRCIRQWTHALETVPDEYRIEVRNRRHDGQYRWFQTRAVPARDNTGSVTAWHGITTDIHDRIETENRLALLAEISELTRNLDDPNELTYAVSKTLGEHLRVRRCLFNETDLEKDLEIVHRDYSNGVESVAGTHKLSDYSSMTSAEMSAGKTVVNHDSKIDPRTAPDYERTYEANHERAYVAIPLMRDNRWVGTLWVSDDQPRQWSKEEVSLLETVAERTWTVIEKLRIDAALRASEQLYRTIARSVPGGGVYVVDKDFRYLVAEGSVTEAFGLSRNMLEGHTVSEIFPPEASARMEERLRQTFDGETISFETQHKGRVYWTQQAPLLDSIGQAIIITLDITERKKAEEALRQSEERFVRFMTHLPGLAWIKDLQGRYVYANAAAEKAFNTPQDKLYGKTDQDIFPAETAAQYMQNDRQAAAQGTGIQVIETLQHEDGVLHYSLVSKFAIAGPDGNIAWVGGTAFDITDRKRAEEALQQLNLELEERVQNRTAELSNVNIQLLQEIKERSIVEEALRESDATTRLILDTSPDVIVIANKRGQIQRVNAQIEKLFGYESEEVVGKPIEILIPPRFHGRHIEHRAYYSANPHRRPMGLGMELFGERKDGTEFSVDVMLTPIHHIADWDTMVTIRDSTERKQMENALRDSHKRLQALSKRLVEVQEEERRAIARELHDRVGQSLAALNLNLTIVNNQLSSLVNEQVNARLSDSLDLVAELIALVRDVMSNLRPAVLDDYGLEAALQTNLDTFKTRYGIAITFEKNQSLIPRLGPSIEMTLLRIAQEALLNVVRHAQADQITLSLQLMEQAVRLTVQDNGIGIQSWQLANYPGSHGLMIMRERAEAVGGNLKVSSTPGKGTEIEASIPFQEKASSEEQP